MMPNWTGVNQTHDWVETCQVVYKYVRQGYEVMVKRQDFPGTDGVEHALVEYEVYVNFED